MPKQRTGKTSPRKPKPKARTKVTSDITSARVLPSATPAFRAFSPASLNFLVELGLNNDRDWFKANQTRYEAELREPTLAFIRALAPRLAKISPHILACDKRVGGSMMRPQRDTRFSKNTDPYKTNVGVQFRNVAGKDVHAPGFYFHFDPESVFVGVGMWHPDGSALVKIRRHIDQNQKRWSKVLGEEAFLRYFRLEGESLTRPPKGFAAGHPLLEHLKRKDHIGMAMLSHSTLHDGTLVEEVERRFRAAKPFMKLLHDAIGLSF